MRSLRSALALAALAALSIPFFVPPAAAVGEPGSELTDRVRQPFTGDLGEMLRRRQIRVLVVPSQTFYFVDGGTQRANDSL